MRPLEGLTVIAVEQAVAAPFCTARLADAGARVIKIERPGGDFARGYDATAQGQSSYFVWLNRGKESRVLDLAAPEGRADLAALIGEADVLVQNLRPGAMARMGLDPGALRARHPRLVTCCISGYAPDGPRAARKAYDLLIQAESGLAAITGGPAEPARVGISIVDIATGASAHAAILEALIGRGITGEGVGIRLSMFDVIADWMAVPLLQAEGGKPPARVGLSHPSIAPYGAFTARDGTVILLSIQSEREWRAFCAAVLGDSALADDPRFAGNVARVANRAETDALVARAFAAQDGVAVARALEAADIAFAEVNDMAGLSRHPELRRATVQTPAGPLDLPAPAAVFADAPRALGAVPGLEGDPE